MAVNYSSILTLEKVWLKLPHYFYNICPVSLPWKKEPVKSSTEVGSRLTRKYYTRLVRLAKAEYYSFFGPIIGEEEPKLAIYE